MGLPGLPGIFAIVPFMHCEMRVDMQNYGADTGSPGPTGTGNYSPLSGTRR